MSYQLGRRSFLIGAGALAAGAVAGCATSNSEEASESPSAPAGSAPADASGAMTVQSSQSEPQSEAGMKALVDAFVASGAGAATLNTVAAEQFRTQLPTYLTSANPPDAMTWLAGKVAQDYADDGLLLDVSDIWEGETLASYPEALKRLSTSNDGKKIFVPQFYYWVAVYYRKSKFAEWGVTPPKTWDEFKTVASTIEAKGVPPIGIGLADSPWLASAWFDYFNIRVNGAPFHLDVLSGRASFADPKVADAMNVWKEIVPYFDERAKGLAFQEAQTQLFQGNVGMFLAGAWFATGVPAAVADDLDFFQFPIIDPSVPVGEEGPADGFFASAKTTRPGLTKKFLEFTATPAAQELYLETSKSTFLPANPAATFTDNEANRKGKALLEAASDVTQFFNRDGGDELQPTADNALVKFLDNPNDLSKILADWQVAAEKVRQG